MFSEQIRGFGLRHAIAVAALLLATALVFTHSAGADDPAFAPTITLQTSTTRAAAHPDARITIDNSQSSEQIKDLTIDLPDGMVGSLNAAVPCSVVDASNAECPASAQIGTVTNYARVDNSDVVLPGKVYLTDALPLTAGKIDTENGSPNTEDPASMQVVVPGKIGGVDMGNVVVNARVQMHYAAVNPGWSNMPTGAVGSILGVRTVVNDVPDSITDSHGRTVTFKLNRMDVDLRSNQTAPRSPLLTNSSRCRTRQISLAATSYASTNASDTQDYTTTQCADVHFSDPESMTFGFTNKSASAATTFDSTVEFADNQPTLDSMSLQMPASITVNGSAVGSPNQQCPVNSLDWGADGDASNFAKLACPPEAKVGTVEIETPLLPDPVVGELWLVEASPVPNMGIYIDPTTGPNNPAGVTLGVGGMASTPNLVDGTCSGVCRNAITMTFTGLPDMPIKKVTVHGDPSDRTATPSNLSGNILNNAASSDLNCQPIRDVSLRLSSWVGWDPDLAASDRKASAVANDTLTGCNTPRAVTMGAVAPYGEAATTNPPDLSYTNAQSATIRCGVDTQLLTAMTVCNPSGGIGGGATFTPASPLDPGVHQFFARISNTSYEWRTFSTPVAEQADTTAPTVTLGNEPGATTADTTPSVDFSSDEDAYFQCSLDDGPYLPCDTTPGTPAQSGSYTVPNALIPNDDTHTIDVRAQDADGNISSVKSTSFKVDVPLDPTLDIDLSTTKARAHPTMDLTVTSGSHEDIKNLKLSMPDGFMGSLNGVTALCPIAVANAGNCTDASQVGTVDTEAIVDQSTVRISGKVFMTDPIALGDPAGLYVDVPAKIQSIDEGHVLVPVRLAVRGEAEGIDSFATDLPTGLDPALWQNPQLDQPSEFDLRSMTLKLRNNPSASQPLLTNPSGCTPDQFSATFTGYGSTVVSKNVAFQSTDCGALAFTPSLNITQKDSSTGGVPGASTNVKVTNVDFTATVNANPNDAGIKNVDLILPRGMTIDVGHLPYPCQPEEAAAKACPATSAIGDVVAISPLLPEPLKGTVYVLKSTTSLPRMLIALRGRINVDLTASNSFYNINQIHTTMDSLPDVPLSSFTMNVNKFLRTQNWLCEDTTPAEWKIVGSMTGQNSASQGVNIPLNFNCPKAPKPSVKVRFSGSGKNFSARVYATAPKGSKITGATISLPSGVKIRSSVRRSTKQMGKYLPVYVDHRKLRTQCYGKRTSSRFDIKANKKSAKRIKVWFKKGSLTTHKKFTRKHPPKFKIKLRLKDASGKTISVNARTRAYYRGVRAQSTRKLVKRTSVDPC